MEKKAVEMPAQLAGITAKVDGSLGLRFNTPELSPEEKAVIMNLQGDNVKMFIAPEEKNADVQEIEMDRMAGQKSPSQRLRNTLFVYAKQLGKDPDTLYKVYMEKIINDIKEKLL